MSLNLLVAALSLLGCAPTAESDFAPPPELTEIQLTHEGVSEALEDMPFIFGTAVGDVEPCEPVTRIELIGQSLMAIIDASDYSTGAVVLSPDPPFLGPPPQYRAPTLAVSGTDLSLWSGGVVTLAVDRATWIHTVELEGPMACPHYGAEGDCVALGPVSLSFTGRLEEVVYCGTGHPGDEISPSGLPYCIPNGDFSRCGGDYTGDDVVSR